MDIEFDEFEQIKGIDVKLMKRNDNTFDAISESPFFIPTEKEDDISEFVREDQEMGDVFALKETKSRRKSKVAEHSHHALNSKEIDKIRGCIVKKTNLHYSKSYLKYIQSFNSVNMRDLIEEFVCFKGKVKPRRSHFYWEILCKNNVEIIKVNELREVRIEAFEKVHKQPAKKISKRTKEPKKEQEQKTLGNDIIRGFDEIKLIKIKKNEKIVLPDWMKDESSND